jgi:hypothetical protein
MLQDEVDRLLSYADELLVAAEEETQRSEEDVVTHLVCMNSRQSLVNYFAVFLMRHKVTLTQPLTLQSLLDQCKRIDARFEEIDLSPMHCRCETHDNDYCLATDQVKKCMRIAQWARSIVSEETPGF